MKRAFDGIAALLGLILLSPVLKLAALAIWIEDRHSPFFLGTRVARGGGDFRMVKFRTMILNAWKTGVNSTSASDRRITRVGRLLRGPGFLESASERTTRRTATASSPPAA